MKNPRYIWKMIFMMPEYEFSFRREGVPVDEAFVVRDAYPSTCFDIFLDNYPIKKHGSNYLKIMADY